MLKGVKAMRTVFGSKIEELIDVNYIRRLNGNIEPCMVLAWFKGGKIGCVLVSDIVEDREGELEEAIKKLENKKERKAEDVFEKTA